MVVMTNGTYFTDRGNAESIAAGVKNGERLVDVVLDLHGDGTTVKDVRMALAGLVMMFRVAPPRDRLDDVHAQMTGKVRRLR